MYEPGNDSVEALASEQSIEQSLMLYDARTISLAYAVGHDKFVTLVSQSMIDRAIRMRADAKTDRQIAKDMDVTPHLVRSLIVEGIRTRILQSPEEIRQIELDKFDNMEQKVLTVVSDNEGPEGSSTRLLAAVDRLIKISESRRKLLGLDAPQVVEHMPLEVKINGVNIDEL